jgi:hypothetical protein
MQVGGGLFEWPAVVDRGGTDSGTNRAAGAGRGATGEGRGGAGQRKGGKSPGKKRTKGCALYCCDQLALRLEL